MGRLVEDTWGPPSKTVVKHSAKLPVMRVYSLQTSHSLRVTAYQMKKAKFQKGHSLNSTGLGISRPFGHGFIGSEIPVVSAHSWQALYKCQQRD